MNLSELPGADIILPGIDDLHNSKANTVGSLLIAIAATRLTKAGLNFPKDCLAFIARTNLICSSSRGTV
jgi:hypothetical protein